MYDQFEFPKFRESPDRALSSSELKDAHQEFSLRADESRTYLTRYRSRSNTGKVREMLTALARLEIERLTFVSAQTLYTLRSALSV